MSLRTGDSRSAAAQDPANVDLGQAAINWLERTRTDAIVANDELTRAADIRGPVKRRKPEVSSSGFGASGEIADQNL